MLPDYNSFVVFMIFGDFLAKFCLTFSFFVALCASFPNFLKGINSYYLLFT